MQPTDTQVLTLAIAVVVPLSLSRYSNSRITEAKETLRAEMRALDNDLRSEMRTLHGQLGELRELKAALKIHELEHHRG